MSSHSKSSDSSGGTITRRNALKALGGVLAASAVNAGAAPPSAVPSAAPSTSGSGIPKRPNVLWITGEGVPVPALSCYGGRYLDTPNIDRIAKEGVRFENAFCTNGLCAPSRATLLTGTYSHVNGILGNPEFVSLGDPPSRFDPAQETLAKVFKRNGYQTGTVGKWHLPVNPAEIGFDYFVYKEGAGGPYYNPTGYLGNPAIGSHETQNYRYEGYETDVMTDLCIKGLQQFKQPFFMMMQFFNTHRPWDPPHKYEHMYDDMRFPEPGTFWDDYSMRASPAHTARMRVEDMPDFDPPADFTPRQRRQWNYQKYMQHFFGTLRSQDDNIGRLFKYLEDHRLLDNTIIVYTCDHGFFLGDHGWFDKRFMYEQAIRVPWMIRCPGAAGQGTVRKDWVINIDNAPTILDLAGLSVPTEMQGKSIAPILRGQELATGPNEFYYHYYEMGTPHWVPHHYGIRTDRYKLISYYTRNEWELFDLEKDPDEMESLIMDNGRQIHPAYEAVARDLIDRLKQLREKYKDNTGYPVHFAPPGD
jgi:arylsulfatase A-like enzyme